MIHQKDYTITCFDVDYNDNLRPTSFMEYAQDMAEIATDKGGYGYNELKKKGVTWVVIRMHSVFHKAASLNEVVTMSTWHRGIKGPFFVRDYQMKNSRGELIASGTSSWVLMDLETRTLAKEDKTSGLVPKNPDTNNSALEEQCPRIIMPKEDRQELSSHKVTWSDLDHNRHVNNVKYVVWALDALPLDLVLNKTLKESIINFNKEVQPGDTVKLFHYSENNSHTIEGVVDGTQCFICKLVF